MTTKIKIMDSKVNQLCCQLTSPELKQRKASVIATLKKLVEEKQEINNGFSYKFNGSDEVLDLLNDFIKSERQCCNFFSFKLSVSDNESPVWLEISGPEGAKEFITTEIEF